MDQPFRFLNHSTDVHSQGTSGLKFGCGQCVNENPALGQQAFLKCVTLFL
jgi:hypothetical protein